ncbi:MAG: thiamine phosphate synthase [Thermoplasmata archaeon]|nr:thiamine phosphate synthase [Thermoplasmata archaeon]
MRGFYFITDDRRTVNGALRDVADAIAGGAAMVQYRRKSGDSRVLLEEAIAIGEICAEKGVPFIVNDRLDIAMAAGADGVHIGPTDLPLGAVRRVYDGTVGVTVSSVRDGVEACGLGASYLGVSPIFPTTTKPDAGGAVGPDLIRRLKDRVDVPLFAIGGITIDRVRAVMAAGADGVCAISATVGEDVEGRVRAFVEAVSRGGPQ